MEFFSCKLPPTIDGFFFLTTKVSTKTAMIIATDATDAKVATGNGLGLAGRHEPERQSLGFRWQLQIDSFFQDISCTHGFWTITEKIRF